MKKLFCIIPLVFLATVSLGIAADQSNFTFSATIMTISDHPALEVSIGPPCENPFVHLSFATSPFVQSEPVEGWGNETAWNVPAVTIERSAQYKLESKIVGDVFVIQVRLPQSYAAGGNRYPVLYVLDADKCFGLAADTADWLAWAQEAPEVIVVGIAYGRGLEDWWQKRSRDLAPTKDASKLWGEFPIAGGAAKFQEFLAAELFPFIESRFRTRADDRALAGISLGGLFGAYTLFTRPDLFQRYILISPAFIWDQKRLWQHEAEYQAKSKALAATVFTAVGEADEQAILAPWAEFNRLIQERRYAGLRWLAQSFPGESHISVLPGALARGLKMIYGK